MRVAGRVFGKHFNRLAADEHNELLELIAAELLDIEDEAKRWQA